MPEKNENLFIVESQSLDVDEQKKNDILSVIESCNSLQDFIKRLEEEKLIWYLIGPLRKDEEVRRQISSKWETDFQEFEQSTDVTHKNFEKLLQGKSFLAYSTEDNNFNIRFENEEKPVKISDILRARDEGEVYNISLGENSQITACRKNGNERHYNFTGSSSCEMMINWQAKDSKGDSISCSMTVEVDSSGIKRVVNEPRFGGITSQEEILKLVEQNKEVFINGKTLYQAFTDIGRNVQQMPKDPPLSPQSPALDSSGYSSPSTPSSRRNSLSIGEGEIFESGVFDDEEAYEREEESLESGVKKLKEKNKYLEEQKKRLARSNEDMEQEDQKRISELEGAEKTIKELEAELERKTKGSDGKDQDIEQLKRNVNMLEQSQEDKNVRIVELKDLLEDKKSEVQLINETNKELQEKLDKREAELNTLKEKNVRLEDDLKKMMEGLEDDKGKQLAEQLMETREENSTLAETVSQLSEELSKLQKEKEDLEREFNNLIQMISHLKWEK